MTPPLWSLKSCKLGNWVVTCPLLLLLETLQPLKLVDEIALWNKVPRSWDWVVHLNSAELYLPY